MLDLPVIPNATVREGFRDSQAVAVLPNGYSASIVCHEFSYGGSEGLYELAVLLDGRICYTTPITEDVIGYMSEQDVLDTCKLIAELPSVI